MSPLVIHGFAARTEQVPEARDHQVPETHNRPAPEAQPMLFVMCFACGEIFAAQASRYYWCACGECLTDGDEIRALVPAGASGA